MSVPKLPPLLKKGDHKRFTKESKVSVPVIEEQETDKVYELFLFVAEKDKEVDWKELKKILDSSMKDELGETSGVNNKKDASGLNAAPPGRNTAEPSQTENEESFVNQLLTLICGRFCKDTPLAEIVLKPKKNTSLMATFAEYTEAGFSKDMCRSMIAMMDVDRSGKLGFEEFKTLLVSLKNWKNVWALYDVDKSGTFTGLELREALHSAGYRLNWRILTVLMHRYGNKAGHIQFDDFIMCAIKVKTMIDVFKAKDTTDSDVATFTLEEWLNNTLYM